MCLGRVFGIKIPLVQPQLPEEINQQLHMSNNQIQIQLSLKLQQQQQSLLA